MQDKGQYSSHGNGRDLADDMRGLNLNHNNSASTPRSSQSNPQNNPSSYQEPNQYYANDEYTYLSSGGYGIVPTPAYPTYDNYQDMYPASQSGPSGTNSYLGGSTNSFVSTPMSPSFDVYDGNPSTYAGSSRSGSSRASSSYASSSYASSSYAASASTARSSAPPRDDPNSVDRAIAGQLPAQNQYELPCEFLNLTGCGSRFRDGDERQWMDHIEGHLRSKFPAKMRCWFCDTWTFDAEDAYSCGDKRSNFVRRMEHIREHIVSDGYRTYQMRPDGYLIKHLKHEHITSSHEYNNILTMLNPSTAPPVPGGRSSRPLEQVREEPASSSRDRRHERKDRHHESSKKKHPRK